MHGHAVKGEQRECAGIEGTAEMYRVKAPFDTRFAFSRFRATKAAPRNVSSF